MSLAHALYDAGLRIARRLSPLASRGSSKIARGLRGRLRDRSRFAGWAEESREAGRPLAWFHAPSVGEGLQARAVLAALGELRPDLQTAYTFFSPSAERLAAGLPVDVAGYLPWDTRREMEALVGALRPDLLVFTKTEVWPGAAAAASAGGVPVVLAAATLPGGARRLRPASRRLLRPTFASLAGVLAISAEDGARFGALGVPAGRIRVTGDPAVDSAWRRAREADPEAPHLSPFRGDPRRILIAGSTWEPDERVLLPALSSMGDAAPRLVVAPHEPSEHHLARLERELGSMGWRSRRLAEVEAAGDAAGADAVLVDRVGVLAQLYTVGTVAYVGGGFHRQGLHSVLEPAAAGLPVLIGPRHANSRDAAELIGRSAAVAVTDAEALADTLAAWLRDEEERGGAALRALGYVEEHRGAAARTAEALAAWLPPLPFSERR